MATIRQINANRENARKSTGPKTPAGKDNSSRNATKHGCSPSTAGIHRPMRHEDPAAFEDVRSGLIETWQPENKQQFLLIEQAASAYMRLRRAEAWETSLVEGSMDHTLRKNNRTKGPAGRDDLGCAIALAQADLERSFDLMDRHRRTATSEFHRAVEALRRLKKDAEEAPIRRWRILKAEYDYDRLTHAAPRIPAGNEAANLALKPYNELAEKPPAPEPPAVPEPEIAAPETTQPATAEAATPAMSTEMASFCEKPGPRLVPAPPPQKPGKEFPEKPGGGIE